jgi:hypothetical protein
MCPFVYLGASYAENRQINIGKSAKNCGRSAKISGISVKNGKSKNIVENMKV